MLSAKHLSHCSKRNVHVSVSQIDIPSPHTQAQTFLDPLTGTKSPALLQMTIARFRVTS